MKDFEFFLNKGDVKKQSPDENLSEATFKDSLERLEFSRNLLQKAKPKYILENAYEAMREAADSILYREGYKSFSHEASIVYLIKKGFDERDIIEFDRFRNTQKSQIFGVLKIFHFHEIRNSIKYYGKDCDKSDADSAIKLAEKIINKIKTIIK